MPVYFDHNATTFLDPRVGEAMLPYLTGPYGNASSVHRYGRAARDAVETARAQVAEFVGVQPLQVVFTSGATEANNMAIRGTLARRPRGRVLIGAIEHPSLWELYEPLRREGWNTQWLPVGREGEFDLDWLSGELAAGDVRLVVAMAANNETGVIQDAAEVGRLARQHGAAYHCDAVQAAGKIPLQFPATGAHSMTLGAHKLFGPKGIGVLILDPALDFLPSAFGGGHERGLRPGTENVAGMVGFGVACKLAQDESRARAVHCRHLRDRLESGLGQFPGLTIFGATRQRLPNTVQFAVPGFDGEALLMALDRKGFAVSSGSACSLGKGEPSHVLLGMGIERTLAKAAIRVSFGPANTAEEVDQFLAALQSVTRTS